MDELAEDLRATTESIAHDAQRLRELELRKASLDVEDPQVLDLSQESRALAERLVRSTAIEEQLAHQVAEESGEGAPA